MLAFCSLFGAGTVRCQQWHGAQQLLATWWRGDQFSECATGQSLASFDKDSIEGFLVKAGTTGYRKYMFECNRVPACRDELFGRCDNIFGHVQSPKCIEMSCTSCLESLAARVFKALKDPKCCSCPCKMLHLAQIWPERTSSPLWHSLTFYQIARMSRMRAQTASFPLETLDHYDHWRWGIMCFSSIQCWLVLIGWVLLTSLGGNNLDVEMCRDNPGLLCDATRISTVFHIFSLISHRCQVCLGYLRTQFSSLVAVEELQALGRCLRLGQRRLQRSMMSRISVALVVASCGGFLRFGYIWVIVIEYITVYSILSSRNLSEEDHTNNTFFQVTDLKVKRNFHCRNCSRVFGWIDFCKARLPLALCDAWYCGRRSFLQACDVFPVK